MLPRVRFLETLTICVGLGFGLSGCGLTTPDIKEIWDEDVVLPNGAPGGLKITGTALIEHEIKRKVFCELRDAIHAANKIPLEQSSTLHGKQSPYQPGLIPESWIAAVSISLQVDESSSLTPGVTFNEVLANATKSFVHSVVTVGQSYNFGIGGTLSSTATRIDKFDPVYSVADLGKPYAKDSTCLPQNDLYKAMGVSPPRSSPFIIESDLGIKDWLLGAGIVNALLRSTPIKGTSPDKSVPNTISYEIKFVIVSNGNLTPTWKLLKISANTSGTLYTAGRTRTHDLIVTIGPPTQATSNTHLASQIGNVVSNANRALVSP